MKKIQFSLLLLILVNFYAAAQKVDLDRKYFQYAYTALPYSPLPAEYKTYNTLTVLSPVMASNFGSDEIENSFNLDGFTKVVLNNKSDLSILFNFADFTIENVEVLERYEVQKDKAGNETGRTYYYWVQFSYSYRGLVKVQNNLTNKELDNTMLQRIDSKIIYKSAEYGKRTQAVEYYNNNKEEIRARLIRNEIKAKVAEASQMLTSKYGYKLSKVNLLFWNLGEKKHPEFELNNKIFEQLKESLDKIEANQPLNDVLKANFTPIIEYFNDVKVRFNKNEKGDAKMRYAAFYNLSRIYWALEDYDSALKEADGLFLNGYDKNDSKSFIREVENTKEQLLKNNSTTTHFVNPRVKLPN